ncbi:MAG: glycosyltransferase family 39 protein, partial [Catenulispora sp.]
MTRSTTASDQAPGQVLGRRPPLPSPLTLLTRASEQRPALFLIALVVVAAAVRVSLLDRDYWADEIAQYRISQQPSVGRVLDEVERGDRFPPAFALLVHGCFQLGSSEAWGRLPSLASGLVLIPVSWLLGRAWVGPTGAVVMSCTAAAGPQYIYFSCESRPYELGLVTVCVILLASHKYTRKPSWRSAAVLSASIVAGTSVQYAALPIAAAALVAGLGRLWQSGCLGRPTVPYNLFVVGTFVLTAVVAGAYMKSQIDRRGTGTTDFLQGYFFDATDPVRAGQFAAESTTGLIRFLTLSSVSGPRWHALCGLAWLPAVVALAYAARGIKRHFALLLVSVGTLLGFIVMAGVGLHPYGGIRQCLALAPGLFLLYSCGVGVLHQLPRPCSATADAAFVLMMGLMVAADWRSVPALNKYDIKRSIEAIESKAGDHDEVVVVGRHACIVFE